MSTQTVAVRPKSPADVSAGYDQCWYALELSANLKVGEARSYDFCDGRVVAYRGEDGVARVMTAWCRHLGADLGLADVIGNEIRCPYHHWRFGDGGVCTGTAAGDRVPASAKLFEFAVSESWDLIWVFSGPEPLYEVPGFDGYTADQLHFRSFEMGLPTPLPIPPAVFASNVFDFQHLRVLHHAQLDGDLGKIATGDHFMSWTGEFTLAETGAMDVELKVMGTNAARLMTKGAGVPLSIGSASPQGPGNTRMFMTLALPIVDGSTAEREKVSEVFAHGEVMHNRIVNEDYAILMTIRFREDTLVASDKALGRFFNYQRNYPKFQLADVGGC